MLLSKEERNEVANTVDQTLYETSADYWDAIIDGELRAQLKQVVEWLNENMLDTGGTERNAPDKVLLSGKWQALLKEIQD